MAFLRFVRLFLFKQNRNHSDQVQRGSVPSGTSSVALVRAQGLDDPPLHDARVLSTRGDEVAVFAEEIHVGDMAAVPAVYVAWSLKNDRRGELTALPAVRSRRAGALLTLLGTPQLPAVHLLCAQGTEDRIAWRGEGRGSALRLGMLSTGGLCQAQGGPRMALTRGWGLAVQGREVVLQAQRWACSTEQRREALGATEEHRPDPAGQARRGVSRRQGEAHES